MSVCKHRIFGGNVGSFEQTRFCHLFNVYSRINLDYFPLATIWRIAYRRQEWKQGGKLQKPG